MLGLCVCNILQITDVYLKLFLYLFYLSILHFIYIYSLLIPLYLFTFARNELPRKDSSSIIHTEMWNQKWSSLTFHILLQHVWKTKKGDDKSPNETVCCTIWCECVDCGCKKKRFSDAMMSANRDKIYSTGILYNESFFIYYVLASLDSWIHQYVICELFYNIQGGCTRNMCILYGNILLFIYICILCSLNILFYS